MNSKYNTTWGKKTTELKYKYENETDLYNGEVKVIKMTKEGLEEYLKELELKNRYKNKHKGV